jgi:hypothetical protein
MLHGIVATLATHSTSWLDDDKSPSKRPASGSVSLSSESGVKRVKRDHPSHDKILFQIPKRPSDPTPRTKSVRLSEKRLYPPRSEAQVKQTSK